MVTVEIIYIKNGKRVGRHKSRTDWWGLLDGEFITEYATLQLSNESADRILEFHFPIEGFYFESDIDKNEINEVTIL